MDCADGHYRPTLLQDWINSHLMKKPNNGYFNLELLLDEEYLEIMKEDDGSVAPYETHSEVIKDVGSDYESIWFRYG